MSLYSFVIMAGGRGVRMGSEVPKPLREIDGRSMLEHSVSSVRKTGAGKIVVVAGNGEVGSMVSSLGCEIAWQREPLGTADALKKALPLCYSEGRVLVTCADIPLVTAEIFNKLSAVHERENNYLTILSAEAPDASGYGRIIKAGDRVTGIVEEAEASPEEKKIRTVNSGVYCIERAGLEKFLSEIERSTVKGEYYLTDLIGILVKAGERVGETSCDWRYVRGVNTPRQLEEASELLKSIGREENAERT